MKLEARISIDGKAHKLVAHDVALRLGEVGTAAFTVQADSKPAGAVLFDAGYTAGVMHRFFIGYVVSAAEKSSKHWQIQCREICDALKIPVHLSLRHCLLPDVLREVAGTIALDVTTASGKDYATRKVSRMASTGDGFYALRNLARVFSIVDFVWWQTATGGIWCGAWADSVYAQNGNIEINHKMFSKQQGNSATLAAMPAIRPGMLVNGRRVEFVRLTDTKTVLRWKS